MTPPLVSIGLPVYNGERFVAQAIESILAQSFTDLELVICDNASTDATPEICRRYATRDARVRYERSPQNRGAAYNYNRVTALSRGKYIRHAAHDDVLAPTNIERCVEILEADPGIALAYPQMSRIDEHGTVIDTFRESLILDQPDPVARWRGFLAQIDEGSMCDPVFGLFRADVLRATPVLRTVIGADMLLLADVALRGRIAEVPEVLFYERWHPGTSVNANPTLDDRAAWFDPGARGNLLNAVPHWRWLAAYVRSISRAPLQPAQRAACLVALRPWIWEHKRGLVLGPIALAARLTGAREIVARADRAVLGAK
ncbi:MAG TPA: glycosyltransferase [Candidatus Acidoferrum sp.]|nr:glycosyltransferase [Candidatus Acidoferrum sp.]